MSADKAKRLEAVYASQERRTLSFLCEELFNIERSPNWDFTKGSQEYEEVVADATDAIKSFLFAVQNMSILSDQQIKDRTIDPSTPKLEDLKKEIFDLTSKKNYTEADFDQIQRVVNGIRSFLNDFGIFLPARFRDMEESSGMVDLKSGFTGTEIPWETIKNILGKLS